MLRVHWPKACRCWCKHPVHSLTGANDVDCQPVRAVDAPTRTERHLPLRPSARLRHRNRCQQVDAGWGTAHGADDLNINHAGCGPGCRCSGGCAIAAGALMLCAPIAAAGLSGTVSRPGCQTPRGTDLSFASKRLPPALRSANSAATCGGRTPTGAMAAAVRPPRGPFRPRRRRQGEGCQPLQRQSLGAQSVKHGCTFKKIGRIYTGLAQCIPSHSSMKKDFEYKISLQSSSKKHHFFS